jgi:hypothetical protein
MSSARLYLNGSDDFDGGSVVRFKNNKGSKKPMIEKPTIHIKGTHETPDELGKDIFKALKKEGFKQQAQNFRQDVNRLLETNENATDSDVMQVAYKHCICHVVRHS